MHARLYEVWFSRGNGFSNGPKFRLLDDARRYVVAHLPEASFAIRNPDGHWETFKRSTPQRGASFR